MSSRQSPNLCRGGGIVHPTFRELLADTHLAYEGPGSWLHMSSSSEGEVALMDDSGCKFTIDCVPACRGARRGVAGTADDIAPRVADNIGCSDSKLFCISRRRVSCLASVCSMGCAGDMTPTGLANNGWTDDAPTGDAAAIWKDDPYAVAVKDDPYAGAAKGWKVETPTGVAANGGKGDLQAGGWKDDAGAYPEYPPYRRLSRIAAAVLTKKSGRSTLAAVNAACERALISERVISRESSSKPGVAPKPDRSRPMLPLGASSELP